MSEYRVTVDDRKNGECLRRLLGRRSRAPFRVDEWHRPRFYRLWRFWFRVVRRMTFHRYLIHMRKFGLGD